MNGINFPTQNMTIYITSKVRLPSLTILKRTFGLPYDPVKLNMSNGPEYRIIMQYRNSNCTYMNSHFIDTESDATYTMSKVKFSWGSVSWKTPLHLPDSYLIVLAWMYHHRDHLHDYEFLPV